MSATKNKRFISIRLSEPEFTMVHERLQRSTCRSLTEYVKKVLLNDPVRIKVRDESKDQILEELIRIKNRLDSVLKRTHLYGGPLLQDIADIKSLLRQIAGL